MNQKDDEEKASSQEENSEKGNQKEVMRSAYGAMVGFALGTVGLVCADTNQSSFYQGQFRAKLASILSDSEAGKGSLRRDLHYLKSNVPSELQSELQSVELKVYEKGMQRLGEQIDRWADEGTGDIIQMVHYYLQNCELYVGVGGHISDCHQEGLGAIDLYMQREVSRCEAAYQFGHEKKSEVYLRRAKRYRVRFQQRCAQLQDGS